MDFEHFSELDVQLRAFRMKFFTEITDGLNKLIFLGLRGKITKESGEVVKMAASRDGYAGHKTFSYNRNKVSHFYIRFRNAACAEKAIVYFRAMDNKFNADIVQNILLTWYMVEKAFDKTGAWTSTYVDIQGNNTDIQNLLEENKVRSLLCSFGEFYIPPSNETFPTFKHVLFPTMAQALAATIATGGWFHYKNRIKHQFEYRVRMVGNSKEAMIFECCRSSSREAFEMDYFVPALEVRVASELPEGNDQRATFSQRYNESTSSGRGDYHGRGSRGGNCQGPDVKPVLTAKSTPESNEISDKEKAERDFEH